MIAHERCSGIFNGIDFLSPVSDCRSATPFQKVKYPMFTSISTSLLGLILVLAPAPREKQPDPRDEIRGMGLLGVAFNYEPDQKGIYISEVHADGPADKGGIKEGDVLIKFNNKPVPTETDRFVWMIARTRPMSVVPVVLKRDGQELTVNVKMGLRPADFPYPLPPDPDAPNTPQSQKELPPIER
jgi:predicted metalloprotease with PDZ domain